MIRRCPSIGPDPWRFRCGLTENHGGSHTALMETGSPWALEMLKRLESASTRDVSRYTDDDNDCIVRGED